MTKQEFVKLMDKTKEFFIKEDAFNKALDAFDDANYHCFMPYGAFFEVITVPFILSALNLEEEDKETLFYFVYDSEFGTLKEFTKIYEIEKETGLEREFIVDSAEALWDYFSHLHAIRKVEPTQGK